MAEKMQDEDTVSTNSSTNSQWRLEYNTKRLISVEFPGLVKNPSHLVECFGGEGEMTKVFSTPSRRLTMSLRPEDPYSKIQCGDRFPSTSLLLRVRRRKKKAGSAILAEVKETHELKQEVVGVVDTTYRFNSLADYQYLSRDVKYPLSCVRGLDILDEEQPRFMPPIMFSRNDQPTKYQFKPDLQPPQAADKEVEDEDDRRKASKMRVRQSIYALAVSQETKQVPQKPHEKALKTLEQFQDDQLEVIQKLFNIRPIWSRMALHAHVNINKDRMKLLLSCVAYYYLNGPWRALWVKIGYDPRKDPSAKIYQIIDFRIGARTVGKNIPIPRKNKFNRPNIPALRKSTTGRSQVDLARGKGQTDKTPEKEDQDLPYVFTANKLPVNQQVFYQLCDIHIAEVQELISENDGEEIECHEKEGWVQPGTLDKIRDILVAQTLNFVENYKKDQPEEKDKSTDEPTAAIPWEEHQQVKSFLDMLEGDDDIETYDVFGNDSDEDIIVNE